MADAMLEGVKVIDLTQGISGPYCTKLLADYGADVVKIEQPEAGDVARGRGPFPDDSPNIEKSGLFLTLNTNKKSLTLNLKSETGKGIFRRLIANADIVMESFSPGVMQRLGFDYQTMRELNERIVVMSLSNFGQSGPYRDFRMSELTAYAIGGSMHSTGIPDFGPIKLAGTATLFQAGNVAAAAVIGAYYGVRSGGPGQHIDFSIMESQVASPDRNGPTLVGIAYSGDSSFQRSMARRFFLLPFGAYPCADGYAHFTSSQIQWWPAFANIIGRPEIANDKHFLDNFYNLDMLDEVDELFLPWILTQTKKEVMEKCAAIAGSPVNTMEDLFSDPHFREREFFTEVSHPVAGTFEYPGAPFRPTATPWLAGRAPTLGEHNESILCGGLGYTNAALVKLRRAGVI